MYLITFPGFLHLFLNPWLRSDLLESLIPVHGVRVGIVLGPGTW
ncbi:hypothetical protein [Methanococcoides vulcani]|nr:hypothetical protein [Methanococcoides vulcani]